MYKYSDMNDITLLNDIANSPNFKSRGQLWHKVISMLPTACSALEFGVYGGKSINYFADACPDSIFHGFECFEGLPEDWIPGRPKGTFKIDKTKLRFHKNVIIHDGLFEDTLPSFVDKNKDIISFIHIDCDIYSSTVTILSELKHIILEHKPIVLFDEFYNYSGFESHEFKAFIEFINSTNVQYSILGKNITHQQVLFQIT